jgi:hypothetical protein
MAVTLKELRERSRVWREPGGFPGSISIPGRKHAQRGAWDASYHAAVTARYGKTRPATVDVGGLVGGNQPIKSERVRLYVRMLRAGDRLPPIVTRGNAVVDGNHRVEAARIAGVPRLAALSLG